MVNAAKHKRDGRDIIGSEEKYMEQVQDRVLLFFDLTVIFLLRLSMMRKGKLSFQLQVLNQKYDQVTQGQKRRQPKSGSLLESALSLPVFHP